MVGVAQLVRAPDCGSGGRGFETRHSPQKNCETPLLERGLSVSILQESVVATPWLHHLEASWLHPFAVATGNPSTIAQLSHEG